MDCYQEALDYLYSFTDFETIRSNRMLAQINLSRMEELMGQLGQPHRYAKSIHIAGTKGKGSTAAMIASVLSASGYRTGLYTSPHLIDIKERFRIDGKMISKKELTNHVNCIRGAIGSTSAKQIREITTFELLTALAFLFFASQKVDFQVIEVGLGGRLDATNVISPKACAITALSLDHTEVLGKTIAEIAFEKAGIIKQGIPLVCAPQEPDAMRVIKRCCAERNATLIGVGKDITHSEALRKESSQRIRIHGRLREYLVEIPLLGAFQQENAAIAVGVLETLIEQGFSISERGMARGMQIVTWPGRFQILSHEPLIVVDGAHNSHSARALAKAIDSLIEGKSIGKKILIIGMSCDKDYLAVTKELGDTFDIVVATQSRHARALSANVLASAFGMTGKIVKTTQTTAEAIDQALSLGGKDALICITGSLFIVGEALGRFQALQ